MSSATFNRSSLPVNGTSVLRLRSLAADLALVGRHVVGDVIAQVEAEPYVIVQLQWTTSVGDEPRYAVPIVGQSASFYRLINAAHVSVVQTNMVVTAYFLTPPRSTCNRRCLSVCLLATLRKNF